ncbi:branched-chain amino acid ABC transporter permease [Rhizobium sp. KVB221]|uniref:Branched-chain amino acid ABC transporter permease n=1 Tax=Rhizobium setariae TaxID=2801340 RepID=A0A936YSL0_9HYPH|nr:branched-chain amino acid ABC transporter permease [Rhizobium setariae]MBL0371907.1 branched-chain amino acid ABC transporter permease [Rhizobium setariae]
MPRFALAPELRRFAVLSAIGLAVVASAPLWAGSASLRLLGEFFVILSLAVLWNLLAGYAGLLSVGQQAFVGVGGYALFLATGWGLSPYAAILVAILAATLLAAIFAPLLFRLEGAYFAIGTWVAAETVLLVFSQIPSLGGGAGMSLPAQVVKGIASQKATREFAIYWLTSGIGAATLFGTFALLRSRAGLALTAIRDNPLAAASLGIDIWRTKFLTYVIVAAATGAIGAVISLQKLRLSPSSAFSLNDWTVTIIFIVVIGGLGRLEGAVLGTLIYFLLRELLSGFGAGYMIVLGLVAIIVMLFSRKGLWHLLETRFGWVLFPTIRNPPTEP